MGILDKLKKSADQAKVAVAGHADQIDQGIDKLAHVVDDKTGGKHGDKITKAVDKAHGLVDKLDENK